jgi:hypothetical protein
MLHRIVDLRLAPSESSQKRSLIHDRNPHPFLVRVRSLRAFLAASLRKFLRMEPHDGDFASQRMCPFCGLITPRHEAGCLERGRAFKPA